MKPERIGAATIVVGVTMSLLLLVMLGRVAQLQVAPSTALGDHLEPRLSVWKETPVRGDLMDRRGRPLSVTRFGYRVFVDPTLLPKDLHQTIAQLEEASGLSGELILKRVADAITNNAERAARAELGNTEPELTPDELAGLSGDELEAYEASRRIRGPIRFLPIGQVLPEDRVDAVRALKIPGVQLERRPVREYAGGDAIASLVGKVDFKHAGLLGAELTLDSALAGDPGRITFVRDVHGAPLWIEPGQVRPAAHGTDVRLSIDLEIQRLVAEELQRGVEDSDAAGGRAVVIDPLTGEILAMVDIVRPIAGLEAYPWEEDAKDKRGRRLAPTGPPPKLLGRRFLTIKDDPERRKVPGLARNRVLEDVYEPGSTFKPFVWAEITRLGLARLDEVFDTENGTWKTRYGRPIKDVTRRREMTWPEVLINSSNIGMVKAGERMSFAEMRSVCVNFGFDRHTGLPLPGEATGLITPLRRWSKYSQTSVAFGHEVAITPVQLARAFSAFARPGELAGTLPTLRLTATSPDATALDAAPRAIPANIATLTRTTMSGVADNIEAKLAAKHPGETDWKYAMFGKSGTAEIPLGPAPKEKRRPRGSTGYYDDQYNSSFVAGAPIENPRIVVVVVIDDPGPALVHSRPLPTHYGSSTAGPVVRRIVERSLTYLGAPHSPSRPPLAAGPLAAGVVR